MRRLGKRNQNLLPDQFLERTAFGGEQAAPVDRGILVIDAGWDGNVSAMESAVTRTDGGADVMAIAGVRVWMAGRGRTGSCAENDAF